MRCTYTCAICDDYAIRGCKAALDVDDETATDSASMIRKLNKSIFSDAEGEDVMLCLNLTELRETIFVIVYCKWY